LLDLISDLLDVAFLLPIDSLDVPIVGGLLRLERFSKLDDTEVALMTLDLHQLDRLSFLVGLILQLRILIVELVHLSLVALLDLADPELYAILVILLLLFKQALKLGLEVLETSLMLFLCHSALLTLTAHFGVFLFLLSVHDFLQLFRVLFHGQVKLPLLRVELVLD